MHLIRRLHVEPMPCLRQDPVRTQRAAQLASLSIYSTNRIHQQHLRYDDQRSRVFSRGCASHVANVGERQLATRIEMMICRPSIRPSSCNGMAPVHGRCRMRFLHKMNLGRSRRRAQPAACVSAGGATHVADSFARNRGALAWCCPRMAV